MTRLVEQPKPGMTKSRGAYWQGERAETQVKRRLRQYVREKERSRRRAAKKRAAKKRAKERA